MLATGERGEWGGGGGEQTPKVVITVGSAWDNTDMPGKKNPLMQR